MSTLDYIVNKYQLDITNKTGALIEIPNVGRDNLATLLHELNFKKIVEIGVQRGRYSEVLAKENPQAKVYGVDPWKTYISHSTNDHLKTTQNHSSQEMCDQFYEETKKRLSSYSNYEIIKEYSIDALNHFEDESLDFVYIDANHDYSFVMKDLEEWSKKIRKGGIVAGHDYYRVKNLTSLMHVKFAVNDYVSRKNIEPLLIWGERDTLPGIYRDKRRSWSWVKEK